MTWQENLDAGRDIVQRLLDKPGVPFIQALMPEIPEESGIYLWSDVTDHDLFYCVGLTETGLRTRMQRHWNQDDGGMLTKLMEERRGRGKTDPKRKEESREWIAERVVLRWLTEDELRGIGLMWAENFVIGVLRPTYNRQ